MLFRSGLDEFQGPARSSPGRGTLPSLKTAISDLQPVGGPTGGAQGWHVWPQSGNRLGDGTLKPAHQPMGRTKTGLDAQDLLAKGSGGVGGDLCAVRPPSFAIGLDGPIGSDGVTGEEVCSNRRPKAKVRSKKPA